MKILIIGPYPLTEKYGGLTTHVDKLTQSISAMDGTDVHVITAGNKREQFKRGNVNVHVVNRGIYFASFLLPSTFWFIGRTIRRIRPNILHACGSVPYSTITMLLRNKYPTLLSVFSSEARELQFEKSINYILRRILIAIPNERYVIPRIRHIIVQSHFTKSLIRGWTNSKIYIVPEGIEYERIQQLQLQTSLTEQPDIFIAVHFRKLKGIDILIKAIPKVIKSVPDLKVYIAGSGEEEEELKNMVNDLGVERHIKFLGYISNEEEINRYYKTCKIVVVPSRWDVEPFAPLYAAASGKPAIVSNMCNSSVIENGKTGFVFKSEDVDELSIKMVKLLTDDKLREEMGKAAMEKAKEYDWSKIADRVVEIYKGIIVDFHERKGKGKNRRKRKTFIKS